MKTKAVPSKETLKQRFNISGVGCWILLFVTLAIAFVCSGIADDGGATWFGLVVVGILIPVMFILLAVGNRAKKQLHQLYEHVESGVVIGLRSSDASRGHNTYAVVAGLNAVGETVHQDKYVHPDKWRNVNIGDAYPFPSN